MGVAITPAQTAHRYHHGQDPRVPHQLLGFTPPVRRPTSPVFKTGTGGFGFITLYCVHALVKFQELARGADPFHETDCRRT